MNLESDGLPHCPLCGEIVLAGHLHRCANFPHVCRFCGTSLPVDVGSPRWTHACRPMPGLHVVVTYAKPELPELVDDHSERLGHLNYTREVGKPFSECQTCHATVRFRGEGL